MDRSPRAFKGSDVMPPKVEYSYVPSYTLWLLLALLWEIDKINKVEIPTKLNP